MNDEFYMRRALKLAMRGERWVSPNPMVGAVIVRNDRIIGEGYHRRYGGNHAEINALQDASEPVAGATVYVTLEPCCHYGKTPPCVERLIAARPERVVIGMTDPNPLVCGGSIERLNRLGIATTVGVLEPECRQLNERFIKFMQRHIPFVTLKYAQTLDGRIATATGHSRWISSAESRRYAHYLRTIHDGILVGAGTLEKDDPELTVRLTRGRQPIRVVLDSHLKLSLQARVLRDQDLARTIVAATHAADPEKLAELRRMGIETILVEEDEHHRVDIKELLIELGKRNISSLLIEGGASIITSVLRERMADRMVVIMAPKIAGKGIEGVGDLGIRVMDDAMRLSIRRVLRKDGDLILDMRL